MDTFFFSLSVFLLSEWQVEALPSKQGAGGLGRSKESKKACSFLFLFLINNEKHVAKPFRV
jgi:hypothetical protein